MNPAISMCLFDCCARVGRAPLLSAKKELRVRCMLGAFLTLGLFLVQAHGRETPPLFQISLEELLPIAPADVAIPPPREPTRQGFVSYRRMRPWECESMSKPHAVRRAKGLFMDCAPGRSFGKKPR